MKASIEAVYLPLMLLTVALLGGLRIDERIAFVPPPLFTLVLGMMLFGVLVRGRVIAPERLMSASRTPLQNLNGLFVILATFFAATQAFNLVMPESGLPFLLFNVLLFVLLMNTLAGAPDRIAVLRSTAVIVGAAFVLKFVVLGAISDPGDTALKRVLYALVEGVTLGTLTQPRMHPAAGYVAFATLVLFLIALAMLPSRTHTAALINVEPRAARGDGVPASERRERGEGLSD